MDLFLKPEVQIGNDDLRTILWNTCSALIKSIRVYGSIEKLAILQ